MPATKFGTAIRVEGSPNTLPSITSDINDITWIEESPAGTFTVKNKDLDVRNGGVLTIGDSGDYSVSEKLDFQPTANNGCNLLIQKGGELQLFGNVEIDATTAYPSYYNTWSFNGKFYVRGNVTYKPVIKHVYQISRYYDNYAPTNDRNHNIYDIDYLKFINAFSTSSYYALLYNMYIVADKNVEKWKNIEFGEAGDASNHIIRAYSSYIRAVADDFSKILIEDCKFQYSDSQGLWLSSFPLRFKNCLIGNNGSYGMYIVYDMATRGRVGGKSGDIPFREMDIQQFVFTEGCTFENNSGSADVYMLNGVSFLTKGSTFNHASRSVFIGTECKAYIWSGNTFNASFYLAANSFCFWVNALDLTVKSKSSGNPLADAMVYIRQKDGKEKWLFKTDSAGKPINMAGLDGKIILIHKEQLNIAGTLWDLWSDPSNSTYHEIWIWKEGYEPAKLAYTMDADRTVIVELEDALVEVEVLKPVPFGLGLTGELVVDYPAVGDVEKDVSFDEGAKIGTFKAPAENQVEKDVGFGEDGTEFTGTLVAGEVTIISGSNLEGRLQKKTNLTGALQKKTNMVGILKN